MQPGITYLEDTSESSKPPRQQTATAVLRVWMWGGGSRVTRASDTSESVKSQQLVTTKAHHLVHWVWMWYAAVQIQSFDEW